MNILRGHRENVPEDVESPHKSTIAFVASFLKRILVSAAVVLGGVLLVLGLSKKDDETFPPRWGASLQWSGGWSCRKQTTPSGARGGTNETMTTWSFGPIRISQTRSLPRKLDEDGTDVR
jgi:hypothetical protein